jgi:hypothetical protein
MAGWIGVDLDGTLAHYEGWKGIQHIGAPIPPMVARVKRWLSEGKEVRIMTARVWKPCPGQPGYIERTREVRSAKKHIEDWCREHIGCRLPVTNEKDLNMVELWDDRAVRVVANVGEPCCSQREA